MGKVKRLHRKRNGRIPPPGWTVACQWYAWPPEEFSKRTGIHCAGDGEAFQTREEAVLAAWNEHEADE